MTEVGIRFLWENLLRVVSRRKISMLSDREIEKKSTSGSSILKLVDS